MKSLTTQPLLTQQTLIGQKNGPLRTFLMTKLKNTADSLKLTNNKISQQQQQVNFFLLFFFIETIMIED